MTIPCSNVILSVGQGTVWGDLLKDEAVEFRGPAPIADPVTYQTTVDDIFVGGDMFTGPRFAIDAIAAGKEAAISIHRFVQPGSSLTIGRNQTTTKNLTRQIFLLKITIIQDARHRGTTRRLIRNHSVIQNLCSQRNR